MGSKHYTGRQVALGSGSTSTSSPWFVGDYRLVTMSFESKASLGASRITVYGSNADGFQIQDLATGTSLTTGWSQITGVNMIGVTPGMVTFDPPGYRFMRVAVDPLTQSAASHTTVTFAGVSF